MMCLSFPLFESFKWLAHGFITREKAVDVNGDRKEVIGRLEVKYREILKTQSIQWNQLHLVEQVHGNQVVSITKSNPIKRLSAAPKTTPVSDGLVTNIPDVPLGIYVADCCAVFLVEPRQRAIALLHSGRKGTEAQIAREGVHWLKEITQSDPSHILAALSPCIHPCCYDVDFVTAIEHQLKSEGVLQIWRHPDCTGCHLDRYYSYRKEKGITGRMLAFMMIRSAK